MTLSICQFQLWKVTSITMAKSTVYILTTLPNKHLISLFILSLTALCLFSVILKQHEKNLASRIGCLYIVDHHCQRTSLCLWSVFPCCSCSLPFSLTHKCMTVTFSSLTFKQFKFIGTMVCVLPSSSHNIGLIALLIASLYLQRFFADTVFSPHIQHFL